MSNDWQNDSLAQQHGSYSKIMRYYVLPMQKGETIRPRGGFRSPAYVCSTRIVKHPPTVNDQR